MMNKELAAWLQQIDRRLARAWILWTLHLPSDTNERHALFAAEFAILARDVPPLGLRLARNVLRRYRRQESEAS